MAINETAAGTFVVDFRDQNGKRIRKTFPTYKRASDYDKEVIAQVSRGDFILPSKDTVKDIAEKWHARRKTAGTYRFSTLQNWRTHIDKYIAPLVGDLAI